MELKGLNLDAVWGNIVIQIGSVEIEQGDTLDEQMFVDEGCQKWQKQIQARAEKQP